MQLLIGPFPRPNALRSPGCGIGLRPDAFLRGLPYGTVIRVFEPPIVDPLAGHRPDRQLGRIAYL